MAKVTVYSTPTCPWCDRAKDWLKENKIKFNEIDVSADRKKAEEMVKKNRTDGSACNRRRRTDSCRI